MRVELILSAIAIALFVAGAFTYDNTFDNERFEDCLKENTKYECKKIFWDLGWSTGDY